MSIKRLLRRTTYTAMRLPFAMVWDVLSLGNMGEGESTTKVLREHERQKNIDHLEEVIDRVRERTQR